MSYDVDLRIDTGAPDPAVVVELGNYTSNVAGMYVLAFTHAGLPYRVAPYSCAGSLANLHDMPAPEAVPYLERALAHMDDPKNATRYEAMNPSNKWGNFEGAKAFLHGILDGCRTHPKTVVRVSW